MLQHLLVILLALALAFQLAYLLRSVSQELPRVARELDQPGWWRGAKFHQGRDFAQYIRFLRQNIPESGRVVLPPSSAGSKALADTPRLQFFLMPRPVLNCTSLDCARNISLEGTYLLIVGDFPGAEALARGQVQMFDQRWGLLLPPGAIPGAPAVQSGGGFDFRPIFELLLSLLWLSILAWAGAVVVRRLAPSIFQPPVVWALGFGLGSAASTVLLALASLLGLPLSKELVIGLSLLLAGLALVASRLLRPRPAPVSQPGQGFRPDAFQAAFLVLGLLSAVLSTGRGYHASDELLLWGVKGYGIAASGGIQSVTAWGTNTVPYPLHIPLLIASARLLFGELLPASKLVFSAFYLCLLFLVDEFLRSLGLRRLTAGLAALLIGTAPLIFLHGTLSYANLPLSFYLMAGVMLLMQALQQELASQTWGLFLLSGLMFSAAAWSRPEGWAGAWLLIGGLLALAAVRRRARPVSLRAAVALILPLGVYGLFWAWLKSTVYAGTLGRSTLAAEAVWGFLAGDLHLQAFPYILRSLLSDLLSTPNWGLLGVVILAGLVLALFDLKLLAASHLLLASGLLYLGLVVGLYVVVSYDAIHDLSWWVKTGLDRMLLPGLLLLFLGSLASLERFDHRQDRPLPADLE